MLCASACHPADPRERVAEQFVDRLFVAIDQTRAKELATGLAIAKLDEEIRLKGDQVIDDGTRKPTVTYELLETNGGEAGDVASLVYRLHVAPDGVEPFTSRVILTLRRGDDGWRVANYTLDTTPASG